MIPLQNPASTCRLALLCGLLVRIAAAAPYAYVDANPGNTTLDGAALVSPANYINDGTAGSPTDNKWTFRTDSGFATYEQGNAFESDTGNDGGGDRETTAPLVTTITLPTAATYEVVVVFAQNSGRDVAAKIGSAPPSADLFSSTHSLTVHQGADPQIVFDNSYANGRGANHGAGHLGRITTTAANQAVRILINGLARNTANDDDDDKDNLSNAIEFAFGLDPLRPDSSQALPQPVYGSTSATVSFAPPAAQPGILHQLDWSRNLADWTTVNGTRSGDLLEFTIPTAGEPSIFIRHRVRLTE